jgi:hypothetical protein
MLLFVVVVVDGRFLQVWLVIRAVVVYRSRLILVVVGALQGCRQLVRLPALVVAVAVAVAVVVVRVRELVRSRDIGSRMLALCYVVVVGVADDAVVLVVVDGLWTDDDEGACHGHQMEYQEQGYK